MKKSEQVENIDIYGEQVREVMNKPPHWINLAGTTFMFIFIVILIVICAFVKYPDVLSGRVTLTSYMPAINIVSKTNGKIQKLYVTDGNKVKLGEKLGLIENNSNADEVYNLLILINKIDPHFNESEEINFPNYHRLGNLQNLYSILIREYEVQKIYKNSDTKEKRLLVYSKQLADYKQLLSQYSKQKDNLALELALIDKDVERNVTLLKDGIVSWKDLEDKQKEPLRLKRQIEDISITQSTTQISISDIERNIVEINSQYNESGNQNKVRLFEAYQNLMNGISEWEQTYVIKSPTEGEISYFNFWSENQNIKQGEEIFSIIPKTQDETVGKVLLPTRNAGKLKIGQKAIIKLDNFPFAEFGILEGRVKRISTLPKQNQYSIEISFTKLVTNTQTEIKSKNDIQGSVDIVTDDISLLGRFFYQIRKVFMRV